MNASPLSTQVLNVLGVGHRGRTYGIHGQHLASKLGLQGEHGMRVMRTAISELREAGIPIAGCPSTGYFMAATPEELDEFCIKFLEGRALHSLKLSSRLRQIPLPVLCGQLLLKQEK